MTTHNKCYLPIFKFLQRSICTTIIFTLHVLFQISEVFEILGTNVTFIHLISMFIFMVPLKIIFTLVSMITLVAFVRIGYTNYFIDIISYFFVVYFCYIPIHWRPLDIQITISAFLNVLFLADSELCSMCSISLKVWENFTTLFTFKMITEWQMIFLDMVC